MRKTYRVVGAHAVLGHAPGETFQADLGEGEAYYVDAGHIEVVTQRKAKEPVDSEEEE